MNENCSDDGHDADFQPGLDMKNLPPVFKGRIKALKNLQFDAIKTEAEYYRDVHDLDVKYQVKYNEINQKRTQIIDGSHEPSGSELEWPSDVKEEKDPDVDLSKKVGDLVLHPDFSEDVKGLPKFWLHTLKNANEESLMGLVEPHDLDALAHLTDITVRLTPDNAGFTLDFQFEENPFFTNQFLTKEYTVRVGPNPKALLEYDGPEIIGSKGCEIDWKEGMDLTKKTKKVKTIFGKKDKGNSSVTEVGADSFFDFFSPPVAKDDDSVDDTEAKEALAVDFDVGFAIKEKVIPRAVLYFTGEIFGHYGFEDFDDIGEEEEDDNDDINAWSHY